MNTLKSSMKSRFDTLDETNRLWQELEKNPPLWWQNLLEDKELYVEIRKDNYVNVYYYGGNVALVRWTGGEITAETHRKYLEGKNAGSKALHLDCREKLQTKAGLEELKRHIHEIYHEVHGKNEQQATRGERDENKHIYTSNEKKVQGLLKLRFPLRYIDSEFAYRISDKKLIRFDLVELRGKELVFIELKLITDVRLSRKEKNAHSVSQEEGKLEIVNQMEKYTKFIQEHEEYFKMYYTKVLQIKKRLGLWKGETDVESVSLKPELWIVNTYDKDNMSKGRKDRIANLEKLKECTDFETFIVDYQKLCK